MIDNDNWYNNEYDENLKNNTAFIKAEITVILIAYHRNKIYVISKSIFK